MKIVASPALMEAAYELLKLTPPFKGWRLPDADYIVFCVTADPNSHADFGTTDTKEKRPVIWINQKTTLTLNTLVMNIAHELCHFRQWQLKMPTNHGNYFQRLKANVCKQHGFDPGVF